MRIWEYGDPGAKRLLIQPVGGREETAREVETLRALTGASFRLLAVELEDWNRALSPWPAAPVFGDEPFGGGAAATLEALLPLCRDSDCRCYLGGYSLAGLFALWAGCQTDAFAGIAAASPSVWFPGFLDALRGQGMRSGAVYLSLGEREPRTRNPVMAAVGDCIRASYDCLRAQGVDCTLEWNPGGHFHDPAGRTACAFAWLMSREKE